MTEIDGDLLDEIQAELADRGRDDAVTAGALAEKVGIDDGNSSPATRKAIRALLTERNVPIRSANVGYWICQSEAEAEEYRADLESRIEGIEQRLNAFESAWREWNTNTELSQADRERIKSDPYLTVEDYREHKLATDGGDSA